MGIYDREYYRRDGGMLAGFSASNRICVWLIVINVLVLFIQLATRPDPASIAGPVTNALDLQPDRVLHGEVWRLLTYAFLHSAEWQHIVFNMLFLWWFGRAVEDIYGSKEFLSFYLVSALLGGLAFTGIEALRGQNHAALGASGAVTAVLVVFAMHYPTATVLLFFIIPVPVYLLVILYVVGDLLTLLSGAQTGVAVAIHLAGALFGYLYFKFHWRIMNWWPSRMSMRPRRRLRPRLRVFREPNDEDTALADSPEPEDIFEAQVDEVLKKVARFGKASLSERENQILIKASEVYKQRRK